MAVERRKSCDNIVALSQELGVHRRLLYQWREQSEAFQSEKSPRTAPFAPTRKFSENRMLFHFFEKTLEEEKETDQKLTELAEGINVEAAATEPEHQRSTNQK